ncbi:hypothetical protein NJL88_09040 [Streptomyces sp. DK15]|uniref:hypothetical protein n=1 Tax=Streptomyces sp. DK15 TaxID=2957499 RepID=UPI0029BCAE1F|nr:hypothetical protein [Streptomyces sp. DK15]MDX2390209.1 hypothetical protein [Streptomyces sp. DK15]
MKDKLRKELEQHVPGISKIPGWALPIVADMQERTMPGTVLDASVSPDGTLVIRGTLRADHNHLLNLNGLAVAYSATPAPEGLDVVLVVTDPETATPETPAEITVTATDLATDETVTNTQEVTDPQAAAGQACGTLSITVKEAAGVLAPAEPVLT